MIAGRSVTHLDSRSFWAHFGRIEHEALEFKASPCNLREVIPAMAMTAGGHIVVGVTDDRRLAGCRLDQPTLDAIMRRAQECGVDVDVQPLLVGEVPLTLVSVPHVRDRIVTTSDGRLLRRVGSDNLPLRGDHLAGFLRDRTSRRLRLWRRLADAVRAREARRRGRTPRASACLGFAAGVWLPPPP